ncbi:MAG: hypothetical protein AAF772_15285 [Acidobacteriota bacterium]
MNDLDSVRQWLEDRWIPRQEARTPSATLYDDYAAWCDDTDNQPVARAWLGRHLGTLLGHGPMRCRFGGPQVRVWPLTRRVADEIAQPHKSRTAAPEDLAEQVAREIGFDLAALPHPRLEPPEDLADRDAVKLWLEIMGDALAYELDDDDPGIEEIWNAATLTLLHTACDAYGRMRQANALLIAEAPAGIYRVDGHPRTHPAHKIWADALAVWMRLFDRLVDGLPLALAQTVTDRGHRRGVGA